MNADMWWDPHGGTGCFKGTSTRYTWLIGTTLVTLNAVGIVGVLNDTSCTHDMKGLSTDGGKEKLLRQHTGLQTAKHLILIDYDINRHFRAVCPEQH